MKFVHNVRTCNFVGLFDCLTCFKSRSFKLVSQFHVWYKYFSGWSPLSFLFGSPKHAPFHPLPCGSCLKVLGSILITNCCLRFCIQVQLLLNQASSPLRAFWSVWWMNASWFEWVRYELDLILSYLLSPLFLNFLLSPPTYSKTRRSAEEEELIDCNQMTQFPYSSIIWIGITYWKRAQLDYTRMGL